MIILNELLSGGTRTIELWPDDVAVVSTLSMGGGSEVRMIDNRVYYVAEDVAEVFTKLEESDGEQMA